MVSALEPVGLMRKIGLGETLRMALLGNGERVGAQTALRIGIVTEIVPRAELEELYAAISETKELRWYPAGHGLGLKSQRERIAWLREEVALG